MKRGAVVAGVLAIGVAAIAAGVVRTTDDAEPQPTGSRSTSEQPDPNASQSTDTTSRCLREPGRGVPGGEILVDLDEVEDVRLRRAGSTSAAGDEATRIEGDAAVRIELAADAPRAGVRAQLPAPLDVQGGRTVAVWMRTNGAVPVGGFDLRVRLASSRRDGFEMQVDPVSLTTASEWCLLELPLPSLRVIGRPDPSAIRALEIDLPKDPAGDGVLWFDAIVV